MMKQPFIVASLVLALLLPLASSADDLPPKWSGIEAAETWLKLIDSGAYAESWEQAADVFRERVVLEAWVGQMNTNRAPFGAVISRMMVECMYPSPPTIPLPPEGEYIQVLYESQFSGMPSTIEQVTLFRVPGGVWKVCQYIYQ